MLQVRAFGALALISTAAAVAEPPAAPTNASSTEANKPAASCRATAPDTIVVCGERSGSSRYRIDPTMRRFFREKGETEDPTPRSGQMANVEASAATFSPGTPGAPGGAIPVMEPVIRVATAVVKAVKGEDWREAFSNGPSDYDLYKDAKAKEESAAH
ncbi:MAG TPA: hypothetical protein VFT61_09655 [Sphingomicrobium sp.]|jgi:hypothetical protein|nr:hypothetical protein [Sphingomicrobium sp.]